MADNTVTPLKVATINHGGAIDAAAEKYGIPPAEWLDLSTGINPQGYPVPKIDFAHWQRLPLASELDGLKRAAAHYYALPGPDYVVCTPGTQSLIQTIPFWLKDQTAISKVHIMGPTYGEHARCWQRAGHDCAIDETTPDKRLARATEILTSAKSGNVVILVNPNNPDGAMFPPTDIADLSRLAQQRDCWLILDEAFMDCQPDLSVCPMIEDLPRTIVLRSFGKFFGLAGARLGCAVMAIDLARDLAERVGPWAIPGPTIAIGTQAFSDRIWQEETRIRLTTDSLRLDNLIADKTALALFGGTDLFRYYHGTDCQKLAEYLAQCGILVRLFDHDREKVRFGFPGTQQDWQNLEVALTDWADIQSN
ncbi:threonine-phosphate decarboxylase CobD [Thalassospira sp.]|uniref:threonine-phosphate decarboxylase CobD n=2 Tax=Thalassospira sp. TaxID=1912094 RepID=UPI0032EB7897